MTRPTGAEGRRCLTCGHVPSYVWIGGEVAQTCPRVGDLAGHTTDAVMLGEGLKPPCRFAEGRRCERCRGKGYADLEWREALGQTCRMRARCSDCVGTGTQPPPEDGGEQDG